MKEIPVPKFKVDNTVIWNKRAYTVTDRRYNDDKWLYRLLDEPGWWVESALTLTSNHHKKDNSSLFEPGDEVLYCGSHYIVTRRKYESPDKWYYKLKSMEGWYAESTLTMSERNIKNGDLALNFRTKQIGNIKTTDTGSYEFTNKDNGGIRGILRHEFAVSGDTVMWRSQKYKLTGMIVGGQNVQLQRKNYDTYMDNVRVCEIVPADEYIYQPDLSDPWKGILPKKTPDTHHMNGTKVRIIKNNSTWFGYTGTITNYYGASNSYEVKTTDERILYFKPEHLELVNKPITADDIDTSVNPEHLNRLAYNISIAEKKYGRGYPSGEKTPDIPFHVGDRVTMRDTYAGIEHDKEGTVVDIPNKECITIIWDDTMGIRCGYSLKVAKRRIRIINKEQNMSEVKKPETNLEKNACTEAKKAVIEKEINGKKMEYESKMRQFLVSERQARAMRKEADELKDLLGITDDEMKELFE